MSPSRRLAVRVARAWVHLYTSRMPAELRVSRRAEIDSDLWEHAEDGQEAGARPQITALEILLRTCLGVVDDLSWRFEAAWQERGASSATLPGIAQPSTTLISANEESLQRHIRNLPV